MSNSTPAIVSIIIPSYNHKRYIVETLNSIKNQTYPHIKIIVIDDGSTDGTGDLLKSLQADYNFQLVLKENEGLCATINKGIDLANGDYIVIIASDDYMPSDRIYQQMQAFISADIDVVAGGMTLVNEKSEELRYVKPLKLGEVSFSDMLEKNVIYAPTAMFRSRVFQKYGKYKQEHVIEDYSMWLKILSQGGKIVNLDKNWAFYRVNQVITRQKIDWYYKGIKQVFADYATNPVAQKALIKNKWIYLSKIAVFDGLKSISIIKKEKDGISCLHIMFVYLIAAMPNFVRKILKTRINRA